MRKLLLTTAVVAAAIGLAGCSKKPESVPETPNTLTDTRDGQKYRLVVIGGKRWMAQNLNYKTDSSWCYKNDTSYCNKYGRLYNWNAAMAACPSGWHLPSRAEWDSLGEAVGGERKPDVGGHDINWHGVDKKLKAKDGWIESNGTDDHGFSAMPGGLRSYLYGGFFYAGYGGYWWTAAGGTSSACWRTINCDRDYMGEHYMPSVYGLSVRCAEGNPKIKEVPKTKSCESIVSGTFTDERDDQTYKTVNLCGKTWMAQNLNYQPQSGKSWCYADNNPYCDKYGRLYDWKTAKAVCPTGWHLPSREDWDSLALAAGGKWPTEPNDLVDWRDVGKSLKARSGWDEYRRFSGNGTNHSGFSALPGGYRRSGSQGRNVYYGWVGEDGHWWTTKESGRSFAYGWQLSYNEDHLNEMGYDKDDGLSVRCIADRP
jgi:uncharacterized protein (TIGR02145 family)